MIEIFHFSRSLTCFSMWNVWKHQYDIITDDDLCYQAHEPLPHKNKWAEARWELNNFNGRRLVCHRIKPMFVFNSEKLTKIPSDFSRNFVYKSWPFDAIWRTKKSDWQKLSQLCRKIQHFKNEWVNKIK